MVPLSPGRMRRLLSALLALVLLPAACTPVQPVTPPAQFGGTIPSQEVQIVDPQFEVSPFCQDVRTDPDLARRLHRLQEQDGHVLSYALLGPIGRVEELAESVVGQMRERGHNLVRDPIPLSEARSYFDPEGNWAGELPALSHEGKKEGETFAGLSLMLLRFNETDEARLGDLRQQLREVLYHADVTNAFPDVQAAPNLRLTVKASTNHSGGGGPFGGAPHPTGAAYANFRDQYAFHAMSMPVPIAEQGDNVTLYVLDTWPGAALSLPAGASPTSYVVSSDTLVMEREPYTVTLFARPLSPDAGTGSGHMPGGGPMSINVHGRFVASLAHTVAPMADIHIYRVLNDAGEAHVSDLVTALADIEAQLDAKQHKAVLNLSLVLDCIEVASEMAEAQAHGQDHIAAKGLDQDIAALTQFHNRLLQILQSKQVVISAAAGNNAFPTADYRIMETCLLTPDGLPGGPLYPACLKNVISVGASTQGPGYACYSSGGARARILAYAGDGGTAGASGTAAACSPMHTACVDKLCKTGVLGLVENPAQYGFWSGTSFATPLVSGAAAVLMGSDLSPRLDPVQVPPCLIAAADTYGNLTLLNLQSAIGMVKNKTCPLLDAKAP